MPSLPLGLWSSEEPREVTVEEFPSLYRWGTWGLRNEMFKFCSELQNQSWSLGLLAPGLRLFKLTGYAALKRMWERLSRHVYLTSKGTRIHSPSHGVVTGHFLLKIAQIPSLFVEDTRGKWWRLEEPAVLEVFFDDNICNCVKDKFDVLRVRSAGHVTVDFFDIFSHVEVKELALDIIPCILIRVVPWFSRKIVKKWDKLTLSCSLTF